MKLSLKNFQIHRQLEIELDKGFSVVLGNSDCGKSSIARAYNCIFEANIPQYFINNSSDKNECQVMLEWDDNIVQLTRSNKVNKIKYGKKDSPIEYERIGSLDLEDYFNFLGNNSINDVSLVIRKQLDSLFFVGISDGNKSKMLNLICGTDLIDNALTNITSNLSINNAKIKYNLEQLETNNKQLSILQARVKPMSLIIQKLKSCYEQIKVLNARFTELNKVQQQINDLDIEYNRLSCIKNKVKKIKVGNEFEKYEKYFNTKNQIDKLKIEFDRTVVLRKEIKTILTTLAEKYILLNEELEKCKCEKCGQYIMGEK